MCIFTARGARSVFDASFHYHRSTFNASKVLSRGIRDQNTIFVLENWPVSAKNDAAKRQNFGDKLAKHSRIGCGKMEKNVQNLKKKQTFDFRIRWPQKFKQLVAKNFQNFFCKLWKINAKCAPKTVKMKICCIVGSANLKFVDGAKKRSAVRRTVRFAWHSKSSPYHPKKLIKCTNERQKIDEAMKL